MTDDDIIDAAFADGFSLEERVANGQWVWGWVRGDDHRWPCYFERGQALSFMADRLRRVEVFR